MHKNGGILIETIIGLRQEKTKIKPSIL